MTLSSLPHAFYMRCYPNLASSNARASEPPCPRRHPHAVHAVQSSHNTHILTRTYTSVPTLSSQTSTCLPCCADFPQHTRAHTHIHTHTHVPHLHKQPPLIYTTGVRPHPHGHPHARDGRPGSHALHHAALPTGHATKDHCAVRRHTQSAA
eukprot:scaffold69660_cov22-Tisochrysis_lutea.AAC.1